MTIVHPRTGDQPMSVLTEVGGDPRTSEIVSRVRSFIDEYVIPAEPALYAGGEAARPIMAELQHRAKSEGLWAFPHPVEIGGQGMPLTQYVEVAEVVGRSEFGGTALGADTLLDALMLHRHGTRHARDRYLKGVVDGQFVPSYAMTEPGEAGSDPSRIRTRAVRDGGRWTITGRKWFTSRAGEAAYTAVLCRTDPAAVTNNAAFTMFVVPTDSPGYELVRALPILGHHSGQWEVGYNDVKVDDEAVLGECGHGYDIVRERLALGRVLRCMHWIGQAQRALDLMCHRLCSRIAFNTPLAHKQLLQQHVFDTYMDISAGQALVRRAVAALEAGDTSIHGRVAISAAKVGASRAFHGAADRAVQVFGAEGLTDDTPLSYMFRHARATRIYDGPDEIHIGLVGKLLIEDHQQGHDRRLAGLA
ncbi:acyl-CoA dehydrogenase family protein [Actinocrispum sp. NPDC049592]|uniref:acyl-CoA dehydrogenase family protein n=1 Tax=Actinocrispum sp. NPDC049592 TaxID=3154835 RepID=UPI00341203F2